MKNIFVLDDNFTIIEKQQFGKGLDVETVSTICVLDGGGTRTMETNALAVSIGAEVKLTWDNRRHVIQIFDFNNNALGTLYGNEAWVIETLRFGLGKLQTVKMVKTESGSPGVEIVLQYPAKDFQIYKDTVETYRYLNFPCQIISRDTQLGNFLIEVADSRLRIQFDEGFKIQSNQAQTAPAIMECGRDPEYATNSEPRPTALILLTGTEMVFGDCSITGVYYQHKYEFGKLFSNFMEKAYIREIQDDTVSFPWGQRKLKEIFFDEGIKKLDWLSSDLFGKQDLRKVETITISEKTTQILKEVFKECKKQKLTIYGIRDSKAQSIAQRNKIKFMPITKDEYNQKKVEFLEMLYMPKEKPLLDAINVRDEQRSKEEANNKKLEGYKPESIENWKRDGRGGGSFQATVSFSDGKSYKYNCRYKYPEIGDVVLVSGKQGGRGIITHLVEGLNSAPYMESVNSLYKPWDGKFNEKKVYADFITPVEVKGYWHNIEEKWEKATEKKHLAAVECLVFESNLKEEEKIPLICTIRAGYFKQSMWTSWGVNEAVALNLKNYIDVFLRENVIPYAEVDDYIESASFRGYEDLAGRLEEYKNELERSGDTGFYEKIEEMPFNPDTLLIIIEQ